MTHSPGGTAAEGGSAKPAASSTGKDGLRTTADADMADMGKEASAAPTRRRCCSFMRLFRYADSRDWLLMLVGSLFAMAQGMAMPLFSVVFGESVKASTGNMNGTYVESMQPILKDFGMLSCGVLVAGTVWQSCFLVAAERQGLRMRLDYFRKVLTRDIKWFDSNDPASMPTRMAQEVATIQDAIGAKSGQIVVSVTQFFVGIAVGFFQGWELTLVLCAMIPAFIVAGTFFARNLAVLSSQNQAWFGKAGAAAEQAFSAIRTVAAFGGEIRETERFESQLRPAKMGGIRAGVQIGLSFGMVMSVFALAYSLAFWFGAHRLIADHRRNVMKNELYTGGDVILVFFAVLIGIVSVNDMSPSLLALTQALSCATNMDKVLQADAQIESAGRRGEELPADVAVLKQIEFKHVQFAYPSRLDVPILQGLSLAVHRGQKVALVGESGSGKSTVIQMLERFYDPAAGEVLVNNVPLGSLPLAAWRRLIGYVGQEPVLFATSVLDNIRGSTPNVTEADAEQAAKQAEAWDFLSKLPEGMHTYVGVGGGQMSGGQKQRIAIARALVKKPQLLLLDEATSALDNESEKQVQATIDHLQASAAEGLTTISIAHRLSTIRNSDTIFVFKQGKVLENGNHAQLMQLKGEYYNLVQSQSSIEAEANGAGAAPAARAPGAPPPAAVTADGKPTIPSVAWAEDGQKEEGTIGAPTPAPGREKKQATSAHDEEKLKLKELAEMKYKTPWGRLFRLSRPEWWVLPFAFLGALIAGCSMPVQGYLFSSATGKFYATCDGLPIFETKTPIDECPDEMLREIDQLCLFFVFVAIASLFGEFCKYALFTYVQECLVLRLRTLAFKNLIKQDVGFFDDPRNGPGGLTTSLARHTLLISQMTGISLGNAAGAVFALFGGIALGFIGSWKLTVAILAAVPALMVAIFIVMTMTLGTSGDAGKSGAKYSVSGEIASEAVLNIRTVRALLAEQTCLTSFAQIITEVSAKEARIAPLKGLAFGFGQGVMFTIYILGFGYGAVLADGGLRPDKMYQALMCVMLGAFGAGFAVTFSGDASKGKLAAFEVFRIIDRPSLVDAIVPTGQHRSLGDGSIELVDVKFVFPHRPDTQVLRGLSFKVSPGQSVALVGPSGSGKSTVIQLLQRFYDPASGSVLVGGVDLRQFDISWWRQQIGFVGQEPVLFDMSLEENVRYGKPDATQDEILRAAKMANMDYVLEGRVGWGDIVGTKGGKLSGGQKQRAAIARALVRDPKVLLLDEATSALDSVSERVVQQALDQARQGRTTFTIAHRLSTVRDCDVILVVASGQIEERGTHDELVALGGLYANLASKGAH